MSYCKTQFNRTCNALKMSSFWCEVLVLIPISMLGIWWPVWFEWSGYDKYLIAAAWFTFGLGSLATIMLQRSFMAEILDNYKRANLIFIVIFCLLGAIFYGKALLYEIEGKPLVEFFLGLNILQWAISINVLVWVWNLVSNSDYDTSAGNPLGENYE